MSSNLKIKRICAWCGKEFIAQKTTTACCSKQCANALYKKKKRDEAIKANNQFVEKKIDEKPIERIKDKPFLTLTETAIYLGVTRPTVYGYIKRGELKVTRLGFKYLLKKEDIDELFNNPTEFHTPTKEKAPITDFYTTAEVKEKYHENPPNVYGFGHNPLYADVIDAIKNDRQPYVTAVDGRNALELVLAIYKSAAEGKSVKLPLDKCSTLDFKGRFDK